MRINGSPVWQIPHIHVTLNESKILSIQQHRIEGKAKRGIDRPPQDHYSTKQKRSSALESTLPSSRHPFVPSGIWAFFFPFFFWGGEFQIDEAKRCVSPPQAFGGDRGHHRVVASRSSSGAASSVAGSDLLQGAPLNSSMRLSRLTLMEGIS